MPTVLVVADPDSDGAAHSLAGHLPGVAVAMSSAAALTEVATGDYRAVIIGTDFDDMCHHELARALTATCERAGRPSPEVYFVEAELMAVGSTPVAATPAVGAEGDDSPAPVVDLTTLITLESDIGDRDFVFETIEVYLSELPDRVAAITQGLHRGDLVEVKPVAHSLKSSSAMLGAFQLAAVCQDIENAAASGGLDTGRYASLLQAGAEATTAELRAHLAG